MFRIIPIVLLALLAGCAENPYNLTTGQWVRNELDGQKYYITEIDTANQNSDGTTGFVRVKNEFGEEVDKRYPIHEFRPWSDKKSTSVDDSDMERLIQALQSARRALLANPSSENREQLEELIEEAEEELSPVFRERKWNPETRRYE